MEAKAFPAMHGRKKPKIGVEFLSIAERFGFSAKALERIRLVIGTRTLGPGRRFPASLTARPQANQRGEAFEKLARETFGTKYALACNSGTGALHASFVAAGVGPGTEVIVPAVGFFATATAVVMSKGVPVFCDVDESLAMDPGKIEALITPRTVAVAPTCVMGTVPDMDPILAVARKHRLAVIEDCAQSPGAKYRGRYVGTLGDLVLQHFRLQNRRGREGLLLTDDERLFERARQLTEYGGGPARPLRPARYEGGLFCGTTPYDGLEAAVDVVQLRKIPALVRQYNTIKRTILGQLRPIARLLRRSSTTRRERPAT